MIHHHGVRLLPNEQTEYDAISRRIDEVGDELSALGGDTTRARADAARSDQLGEVSRQYVSLTARRKDSLYRAAERQRVALRIVEAARRRKQQAAHSPLPRACRRGRRALPRARAEARQRRRTRALTTARTRAAPRRCRRSVTVGSPSSFL